MLGYTEFFRERDRILFWRGNPEADDSAVTGYFQCPSLLDAEVVRDGRKPKVQVRSVTWWSNQLGGFDPSLLESELKELRAYARSNIRTSVRFNEKGRPQRGRPKSVLLFPYLFVSLVVLRMIDGPVAIWVVSVLALMLIFLSIKGYFTIAPVSNQDQGIVDLNPALFDLEVLPELAEPPAWVIDRIKNPNREWTRTGLEESPPRSAHDPPK